MIATSEGSLSGALKSDLLPVGIIVVVVVDVGVVADEAGGGGVVVVDAAGVAAVAVGVGVCARPLLLLWTFLIIISLSSAVSSSLVSC